jgi:hypothetical protein
VRSYWNDVARALIAVSLVLACGSAFAQEVEDPALAGMSRTLRLGIRFYERGDDIEAMDRFMEVVTTGEPAERSMANEYINLITHRMNTGERGPAPQPQSLTPAASEVEDVNPLPAGTKVALGGVIPRAVAEGETIAQIARPTTSRPLPPAPRAPSDGSMPAANRALMKKEIKAKLRATLEDGMGRLRDVDGIRILMMSNGDPQAIAIPAPLLFQSGIAFVKEAARILEALTKVAFSVGGAQIVILPEGTAIGDAKVLDMRRTMGISSHLFSSGVAPARVKVNLLNTQVDIPKPLQDFKGIVILFVYNQPLRLTVESSIGEEAGPPLSLGVFPDAIRPDKGEGAVLEFSVQDPPSGLVSWKFQLLEPNEGGPTELAPLQEVVGGSPVFHQIFWNGRRNYFGAPLPAGRGLGLSSMSWIQRCSVRWRFLLSLAVSTAS